MDVRVGGRGRRATVSAPCEPPRTRAAAGSAEVTLRRRPERPLEFLYLGIRGQRDERQDRQAGEHAREHLFHVLPGDGRVDDPHPSPGRKSHAGALAGPNLIVGVTGVFGMGVKARLSGGQLRKRYVN